MDVVDGFETILRKSLPTIRQPTTFIVSALLGVLYHQMYRNQMMHRSIHKPGQANTTPKLQSQHTISSRFEMQHTAGASCIIEPKSAADSAGAMLASVLAKSISSKSNGAAAGFELAAAGAAGASAVVGCAAAGFVAVVGAGRARGSRRLGFAAGAADGVSTGKAGADGV